MIRASLAALRDFVIISLVLGLVFVICAIMATRKEKATWEMAAPGKPGQVMVSDPGSERGWKWAYPK